MNIRNATVADAGQWSLMRTALWPDTTDQHRAEIQAFFDGQAIDIVQVYVVEVAGDVVGFIELNIRNFAEGSRQSAVPYVEGWYIKPQYQGQHYGCALMARAEQWALSLGFNELASDTEIDNDKSIQLHKRLGFQETERVVCFLKSLSDL